MKTVGVTKKEFISLKKTKILILIMVLGILICAGCILIQHFKSGDEENEKKIEPDRSFLNVYDEEIKTPNQTYEYNNTVMAGNGKLFRTSDVEYKFEESVEEQNVSNFIYIFKAIKNIPAIYVQRPSKYNPKTDILPYGYTISYNKKYDYWAKRMEDAGIPVLDLRKENRGHNVFYYGDHHWTIESAYYATKEILKKLGNEYKGQYNYNSDLYNKNNFYRLTKKGFLGEEAQRSKKLFMGSEKITFLIPKYKTNFEMYEYDDRKQLRYTAGRFEDTLIDEEKLNAEETGKYNACLFAANNEVRIVNHASDDRKKILLIANSLGRSMTMYLSLSFQETRYIDPQQDRFNESIIGYINNYDPDFVVVMFNQAIMTR